MTMTFYYYICNWLVLVLLPEDSGRMPKHVGVLPKVFLSDFNIT